MDSARETTGRTKEALAPYVANARDTALHYADEAKLVIGPYAAQAGAQARSGASHAAQTARQQFAVRVAPHLEQAFAGLPPSTQQATLKAVHRAQEAALAAKISATRAASQTRSTVIPKVTDAVDQARATVTPLATEAQTRGAAALTALHGHVTAAEISELAAKNARKEHRNHWATGLAVAGTLAIGTGVLAWQWWRKQSNPEWLVEPPSGPAADGTSTGATGSRTAADAPMNGSVPGEQPAAEQPPSADSEEPHPKPGPPPGHRPQDDQPQDDRPKPHDPRKPH
ncbi:DUF5324 family protein [Kitasatospora camelliae]|uniref:DUF5324 family protein n=1 Tax=Kitasatospora camelliae TaxID=3156397 RepID=A0AAU8K964_9ACTN